MWVNDKVPLPNASGGMHSILIEWCHTYWKDEYTSCALVTEPQEVLPRMQQGIPMAKELVAMSDPPDMCNRITWTTRYDVVLCQAMLEHTARPSIAMENLVNLTNGGGLLLVHTHSPGFGHHKFPVDCVRFFPDFFTDLARYLPYTVIEVVDKKSSLFLAAEVLPDP